MSERGPDGSKLTIVYQTLLSFLCALVGMNLYIYAIVRKYNERVVAHEAMTTFDEARDKALIPLLYAGAGCALIICGIVTGSKVTILRLLIMAALSGFMIWFAHSIR